MNRLAALVLLCSGVSAVAQTAPPAATTATPASPQGPVTPPQFEAGQPCGMSRFPSIGNAINSALPTIVSVRIATDGSVKNVTVTQSSGYDSLDASVVTCASSWRFKPAIQDGQPVEFVKEFEIAWRLNGRH
jgi:protein TonB